MENISINQKIYNLADSNTFNLRSKNKGKYLNLKESVYFGVDN